MCNIRIQLILQQIHKTSCTFFVACFTIPLSGELTILSELANNISPINCKENSGLPSQIIFFPFNSMHDSNGFWLKYQEKTNISNMSSSKWPVWPASSDFWKVLSEKVRTCSWLEINERGQFSHIYTVYFRCCGHPQDCGLVSIIAGVCDNEVQKSIS